MKTVLRLLLPKKAYSYLQVRRRKYYEEHYFEKRFETVQCGQFSIQAPKDHILLKLQKIQPYRDLFVGITAKFVSEKYPKKNIVDIGANIGDTAALIASNCKNKLILVEASDYFYGILTKNVAVLPNEVVVKKCFISDGSVVSGSLHHWKGTAAFQENAEGKAQVKTEKLGDVADAQTCFIKSDTDGYDFKILLSSLDWIERIHPALLFENHIANEGDFHDSDKLITELSKIEYRYFIVWDDTGLHMLSTDNLLALKDLNRYLYKMWSIVNGEPKGIFNFDILCLHRNDQDIFEKISLWYREY